MEKLIIAAALFAAYIVFILIRFGAQPTLSESYYCLPHRWKWVWTVVCIASAWLAASALFTYNESTGIYIGFAITGLSIVGCLPAFKDLKQEVLHYIGAGMAGVSSVIWQIANGIPTFLMFFSLLLSCVIVLEIFRIEEKEEEVNIWSIHLIWWLEIALIGSFFAAGFFALAI